jgi:release factor glutamine methyltransferase
MTVRPDDSGAAMTLHNAIQRLEKAGVPDPAGDARRLQRACPDAAAYQHAIADRAQRKPVSHILGTRAFWKHDFKVTPDVLDPRPETETLVELALSETFTKLLDLGTGSGCIVISLLAEMPQAKAVGTDNSEQAVLVAGENAVMAGVADRLILPLSDWFDDIGGQFDLIVSNPPYIAAHEMAGLAPEVRDHEPQTALTDRADGLTAYRTIARDAPGHLTPGGRLLVEIGPTQGQIVAQLFRDAGLKDVCIHPDLDGRDRVVAARMPGG